MGLASIVTDINGSREIILEGQNGVIIPPHDMEALYSEMASFVTGRERVQAMARDARTLVSIRYELQYVRRCLKDYYKEILK